MRKSKIIILNGRQYDALTGKPLVRGVQEILAQVPAKTEQLIQKVQAKKPHFINDFTVPGNQVKPITKKPLNQQIKKPNHTKAADIKRELLRSKTLMRRPLKKPDLSTKSTIQTIKKSNYVSRNNPLINRSADLGSFRDSLVSGAQTLKNKASKAVSNLSIEPPINTSIHQRNIQKIESAEDYKLYQPATEQISESKLISNAPKKGKTKKFRLSSKTIYISTIILFIILILGLAGNYFKYSLELSYANFKTGINGSFPKYVPLGYKISNFNYLENGQTKSISFKYHPAHSDLNNYLYIQEANTNLDDAGLVATNITPTVENNYQTFLANGTSVYYFSNQYVWINAGMIYVLTDQTGLSQPVIAKIISSM
ncbi:MAG TPA: hypothetical protein VMV24_01990 [Candidatus Dormibacteraeota bacterium]|nr:hypothetical protein [Candidatus Dormibacteraeota bacterium]